MGTARHTPAENRADLARVLFALALLAWLSTWDHAAARPEASNAAVIAAHGS